uniref:complement subcomponent C1r n=1 Tax=Geotrypetes seraphini TaxID=260995 RepID=A0A6P8PBA6_GEOSA|nr:complement C1r subcomponent isoform X2 [Geotrypetes seraphini]
MVSSVTETKRFQIFLWIFICRLVHSAPTQRQYYGQITSPNYPNSYPNNNISVWDIAVPEGFHVKLNFWQFDLEPSEACNYDYVKISADKKDLGRYCGQVSSKVGNHPGQQEFISRGNQMKLLFNSDFSNEENGVTIFYRGFLAFYQAVDTDECARDVDESNRAEHPLCDHHCHNYIGGYFCSCRPGYQLQSDQRSCKAQCINELFTEAEGYISSPEYPSPYPADLQCNYSIRLEKGLSISLKFLDPFEIDDHQQVECPYDTLQIYAKGNRIGKYCGRKNPGTIDTQSHTVDLLFLTDDSGDCRGWKVHYTSERVRCPMPVVRDKFSILKPQQAEYRLHDYILVSCKTGYKLMEDNEELRSFTSVCQPDGTWHRKLPHCEIVSCGKPKKLENGKYTYKSSPNENTYQSVIKYQCNEPYYSMIKENSNDTYTCTAQRLWKDTQDLESIPDCLPVCGKPDLPVTGIGRIIGGHEAKHGAFPWQVYLRTSGSGLGGGALIAERWILTAAHVIHPKENKKEDLQKVMDNTEIYLGHTEVEELIKLGNYAVENIFVHPGYTMDEHNYNNDIALIKLSGSVTMNRDAMPICLPDSSHNSLYSDRQLGYVSGFGVTENKIAKKLRYVSLPITSDRECRNYLAGKETNQAYVFSENMFCAGFPETSKIRQDSCQGDSGGVFTVEEPSINRWIAVGIVSWGIGCGKGYGFYTKLNNYRDWMSEVMKN